VSAARPHDLFAKLPGRWRGIARVWFEPGVLADESPVEGEMRLRQGGTFLEWAYRGALQGKPIEGAALVGHFGTRRRFEVAWTDSFHMGQGILFSTGSATAKGFSVLGHYPDGQDGPDWGWRTELAIEGPDHVVWRAWNVTPDGDEALATEAVLDRVG
jgi:hypothetical protein